MNKKGTERVAHLPLSLLLPMLMPVLCSIYKMRDCIPLPWLLKQSITHCSYKLNCPTKLQK